MKTPNGASPGIKKENYAQLPQKERDLRTAYMRSPKKLKEPVEDNEFETASKK